MVAKHVFSFDILAEKMGNFAKRCAETSKPFFKKSPEVKSYDVYQTITGKPTLMKEAIYEDLKAFYSLRQKTNDPKIQKVTGEFYPTQ